MEECEAHINHVSPVVALDSVIDTRHALSQIVGTLFFIAQALDRLVDSILLLQAVEGIIHRELALVSHKVPHLIVKRFLKERDHVVFLFNESYGLCNEVYFDVAFNTFLCDHSQNVFINPSKAPCDIH